MVLSRDRLIDASIVALIGSPLVAVTAVLAGLESLLGWAVYGVLVGGVCGWIASPWLVDRRPLAWLGLAVLLYIVGVLAFPLLGQALALEIPLGGGRTGIETLARQIGALYGLTPLGFMSAALFAPATLIAAGLSSLIIAPIVTPSELPQAAATTPSDPSVPLRVRSLEEIEASLADERRAASAISRGDGFGAIVIVGVAAIVLLGLAGLAMLYVGVRSIGY